MRLLIIEKEIMPLKDKEKRKEYHRNYLRNRFQNDKSYRLKHIARVKTNDAKYKQLRQDVVADFRKNGCSFCTEKESCCMDAHHIENKEFNIGDMTARKLSANKIKKKRARKVYLCM